MRPEVTPITGTQSIYTETLGAMLVEANAISLTFQYFDIDQTLVDAYTITQTTPITGTPTPTATNTLTATFTPTQTLTRRATATSTFTEMPTATRRATATPSLTPSPTTTSTPQTGDGGQRTFLPLISADCTANCLNRGK